MDDNGTDAIDETSPEDMPQEAPEEAPVVRALPEHEVLRSLVESLPQVQWQQSTGQDTFTFAGEHLRVVAQAARDAGFELCTDLTAVDYHRRRPLRFQVVVSLVSMQHRLRLRLLADVDNETYEVPSLVPVYPGMNFFEREAFDMFGISFAGHPDLTRILMPDDWVGYPLRKDFAIGSVPVQFKEANKAL